MTLQPTEEGRHRDVPSGYVHAFELVMTPGVMQVWVVGGAALFALALAAYRALQHATVGALPPWTVEEMALVFPVILAAFAVHEWVHGLAMRRAGARPRYGIGIKHGMPYAYATADHVFSRSAYSQIALAPLVLISLATVVLTAFPATSKYALWAGVFNASGAVGDLWIANLIRKMPPGAVVQDKITGAAVYAPSEAPPLRLNPEAGMRPAIIGLLAGILLLILARLWATAATLAAFAFIHQIRARRNR